MAGLEDVKEMGADKDRAYALAIVCGAVAVLVIVGIAFRD